MRTFLCLIISLLLASTFAFAPVSKQRSQCSSLCLSDEPASSDAAEDVPPPKPVKCPDCDLCDGSGRIAGGIGAVVPWIPIKAYRPCPNFIDKGGFYQRSGQGLDEIAFGRDSTFDKGN